MANTTTWYPVERLKTKKEYEEALRLARVRNVMARSSKKWDPRREIEAMLIADYERRFVKIQRPNAIQAIEFRMEQMGYRQKDLAALLGSRARASEILSGKRRPTLNHIRLLHQVWGVPLEPLVLR